MLLKDQVVFKGIPFTCLELLHFFYEINSLTDCYIRTLFKYCTAPRYRQVLIFVGAFRMEKMFLCQSPI